MKKVGLDREGWTAGVGLGAAAVGASGADPEFAVSPTARLGHSINPHWLVLYDLQGFVLRSDGGSTWHAVQNAVVQWHVTSLLYVRGGIGFGYAPLDGDEAVAGPSQTAGLGWEQSHGTSWTLSIEGSVTRFSRTDQSEAVRTYGLSVGLNLY